MDFILATLPIRQRKSSFDRRLVSQATAALQEQQFHFLQSDSFALRNRLLLKLTYHYKLF